MVNEPSIVAINKNTGEVEAVGKEAARLFVTDQNVAKVALSQCVVDREVGTPGNARNDPDPLPLQELHQQRGAGILHDSSFAIE